jgi:hypothetical protein
MESHYIRRKSLMWKRALGFGLLILILVGFGGFAYLYFRKPATAPPSSVKVEITPARLARGKYLFHVVCDCVGCHSERDFTCFGGPVVAGGVGKGMVFPHELGLPGTVVAPNITPDKETGIGNWSDGEKIRAIREGIDRDGKALFPFMPYSYFRQMSDEDVYSLVAYMNALPPTKNRLPSSKIDFPVSMFIKSVPKPAGNVAESDRSNPIKYGEYLTTLGACKECHTPMERGQLVKDKAYSGGQTFRVGNYAVVTPNITPDAETGIGAWTEQIFLDRFYLYKDYVEGAPPLVTSETFTLMPWLSFSQMAPEDLKAIYAFLKTLPPIRNQVSVHP